jgi:hypothetical protein
MTSAELLPYRELAECVLDEAIHDKKRYGGTRILAHWFVFHPNAAEIRELWCNLAGISVKQFQARWIQPEYRAELRKQNSLRKYRK